MATNPNALTMFNPAPGAALPAHIAAFFDDQGSNIQDRVSVPSLSPQGKMWTISLNGAKTKLERRNPDGDMEPVSVMKVVILDYNQRRGRAYYEGEYDPAKEAAPVCWSVDGIKPDDSLPPPLAPGTVAEPDTQRKISLACASCPMSVKGSKITTQNKAVSACGQHRMLAIVPAHKLDFEPLRLKIAMTSDYDALSPDQEVQGWLAFSNYMDWLKARGVKHSASMVTKMKFDPNAAYPKIFFSAERLLEPAELAQVGPLTKDDKVKKLLGGYTPDGPNGVAIADQSAQTVTPVQPQPVAQTPAYVATPEDDGSDIVMTTVSGPAQAPAQAEAPAPVAATPVADPPAAQAAATQAAPPVSTDVPDDVAALLAEWK